MHESGEWLWILACCFSTHVLVDLRSFKTTNVRNCSRRLKKIWDPESRTTTWHTIPIVVPILSMDYVKTLPHKMYAICAPFNKKTPSTYLRQNLVPPKTEGFWLSPSDINCTTSIDSTTPSRGPVLCVSDVCQQTTQPSARNTATLSPCPPSGPRQQKTSSRMESQRSPRFPRNMAGSLHTVQTPKKEPRNYRYRYTIGRKYMEIFMRYLIWMKYIEIYPLTVREKNMFQVLSW